MFSGRRCRALVGAVSLAALLLTAGCRRPSSGRETQVNIRLKWLHQAQFAGFYVADQKGYYAAEGFQVRLLPGGVDFPSIQTVVAGHDQFGVTAADQILLARQRGADVVAVAAIYRRSPFVYFAKRKLGIRSVSDFRGRRIGVKLGGNEELTYRAMLKRANVDERDVIEVPVKYDLTPFFMDQAEAWPGYSINEPLVAEERGEVLNYIWPADYGIDVYADVLFTTGERIRRDEALVRKIVHATLEGWRYAVAHPEEAATFSLTYDGNLNKDHEVRMMKASLPSILPDAEPVGWMDLEGWKKLRSLLLEGGFLTSDVDPQACFTAAFLEHSGGQRGTD